MNDCVKRALTAAIGLMAVVAVVRIVAFLVKKRAGKKANDEVRRVEDGQDVDAKEKLPYEVYLAERTALIDAELKLEAGFDKGLLTIAGAALAFAFVAGDQATDATNGVSCLTVSWIAFSVSVVASLGSMFAGRTAYVRQRYINGVRYDDLEEGDKLVNWQGKLQDWLKIVSACAFLIGIWMFVSFRIESVQISAKTHGYSHVSENEQEENGHTGSTKDSGQAGETGTAQGASNAGQKAAGGPQAAEAEATRKGV